MVKWPFEKDFSLSMNHGPSQLSQQKSGTILQANGKMIPKAIRKASELPVHNNSRTTGVGQSAEGIEWFQSQRTGACGPHCSTGCSGCPSSGCKQILAVSLWASDGEESACSVGDVGSIPRSGRSPGEGNGNPLQYSWLENSTDRGAWWATVHGVSRSWKQLRN